MPPSILLQARVSSATNVFHRFKVLQAFIQAGLRLTGVLLVIAGIAIDARADSPLIGKPAPDFALKSLQGENLRLSEFAGQIVLLNFWATWNGPSRQQLPALEKLYSTYRSAGLTLLGVSMDEDAKRATQFVRTLKVTYPILLDSGKTVAPVYQLAQLPMTVLIDRAGTVRYVHHDFRPGAEQQYMAELRILLNE